MKGLAITGVLLTLMVLWIARRERPAAAEARASVGPTAVAEAPSVEFPGGKSEEPPPMMRAPTAAEKATRVAKIRADYDAIRKGVADELAAVGAAGAAGPGPFGETHVFLRRLALLQREERDDLARVLDEREREELELREAPAGQLVAARLGATAATEAQRRAVFRLEREFDERFGFVFDLTPAALVERAKLRTLTDEKIRAVLGDALFRGWSEAAGR